MFSFQNISIVVDENTRSHPFNSDIVVLRRPVDAGAGGVVVADVGRSFQDVQSKRRPTQSGVETSLVMV